MAKLVLVVDHPGEPVSWKAPLFVRRGRRVQTVSRPDVVAYEKSIAEATAVAIMQLPDDDNFPFPIDRAVFVDVWFYFTRPKSRKKTDMMNVKPDIDNTVKAAIDGACDGGMLTNDSRIVDVFIHKRYGQPNPRTVIRVYELEGEDGKDSHDDQQDPFAICDEGCSRWD